MHIFLSLLCDDSYIVGSLVMISNSIVITSGNYYLTNRLFHTISFKFHSLVCLYKTLPSSNWHYILSSSSILEDSDQLRRHYNLYKALEEGDTLPLVALCCGSWRSIIRQVCRIVRTRYDGCDASHSCLFQQLLQRHIHGHGNARACVERGRGACTFWWLPILAHRVVGGGIGERGKLARWRRNILNNEIMSIAWKDG